MPIKEFITGKNATFEYTYMAQMNMEEKESQMHVTQSQNLQQNESFPCTLELKFHY